MIYLTAFHDNNKTNGFERVQHTKHRAYLVRGNFFFKTERMSHVILQQDGTALTGLGCSRVPE